MSQEVQFWSGNPQNALDHGTLEIKPIESNLQISKIQEDSAESEQSSYLCCPQIPTYLHVIEFCMIIEERSKHSPIFDKKRDLCDLRVLRGPEPAFYILVLKLSSAKAARAFVDEFHQQKFNRIEPDLCEVFTLENVTFHNDPLLNESQVITDHKSTPQLLFEDKREQLNCPICLEATHSSSQQNPTDPATAKQNSPQTKQSNHFERSPSSDHASQSGISDFMENRRSGSDDALTITVLCGHMFHWLCLKDWSDETCPLCRYHQCPQETRTCEAPECGNNEQLLMCLVCGLIGCFNTETVTQASENYADEGCTNNEQQEIISQNDDTTCMLTVKQTGHSVTHYEETKHVYAQNIESQDVWDFNKKDFVNRLIMNQVDGKLVEIEGTSSEKLLLMANDSPGDMVGTQTTMIRTGGGMGRTQALEDESSAKDIPTLQVFNKKVAGLNQEYTAMLASTLESQRVFYQESLQEMEQNATGLIDRKNQEILNLEESLRDSDRKIEEQIENLDKAREINEQVRSDFSECLTKHLRLKKENTVLEKEIEAQNLSFDEQIKALEEQLSIATCEFSETKQERQDLQAHFKAQRKIKTSGKSGAQGSLFML